MKAVEFCYWLQGLFEINHINELNHKQVVLIEKHLNMVFVHEKDPSKYLDFCKNLAGYIKFSLAKEIDQFVTSRVKGELNDLFEHVIEKENSIENNMQSMTSYHKPGMQLHSSEISETVRC